MELLIKEFLKKLISLIGINITRTGEGILGIFGEKKQFAPLEKDKFKWIQNMNIKTVIDVGAHIGQSALQFHKIFPDAMIYSFEPLHDCFLQLNDKLKNVQNFKSFNLALI